MARAQWIFGGILLLLATAGCTGAISGGGDPSASGGPWGGGPNAGFSGNSGPAGVGGAGEGGAGAGGESGAGSGIGGTSGADACLDPPEVGATIPVRRLTTTQLDATVADVLGHAVAYPISDETLIGYRANTTSALDTTTARVMLTTAEEIAVAVTPGLLADARCDGDCMSFVLDDLAPRLFRRPLDADTRARFADLHAQGVAAEGEAGGMRWLLTGMLQSPRFVYMLEASTSEGRLDAFSIAARLSYALWAGPPDQELLEAAASGDLDDAAGITAQTERMIADDKLLRGIEDFASQWLSLDHLDNPSVRPDIAALDEATREALAREPVAFIAMHVQGGSTLAELLSGTETPAEPALAELYGDDVLSTAGDLSQLDPEKRAGLLTLPGVLAALSHAEQTSPTLRGRAVLANLLCRPPAPPPANVNPTLPPSVPGASTRERLEAHFSDASCASCHASMDGIGFALEKFDWLGRSRETENDREIDTSADFEIGKEPISIDGAADLAHALSGRNDVAACLARQLSRFALGVRETDDFDCSVEELAEIAQGPEGLRGMIIALVNTPWFVKPAQPLEEM